MKTLIAISICMLSLQSLARETYYPKNFILKYSKSMGADELLKEELHKIVSQGHKVFNDGRHDEIGTCYKGERNCEIHSPLSYKEARRVLFNALSYDYHDGRIIGVYCNREFDRSDSKMGNGKIPDHSVVNCEHTWPQSKFARHFDSRIQRSDLHHLYPTDSKVNGVRGNHPFGEVRGKNPTRYCGDSEIGREIETGRSNYFEPADEHKGNVARAMFYFSIRYNIKIDSIQENYFRKWHEEDPVDEEEMRRNDIIEEVQGNRNPFIDKPILVDLIRNF